MISIEKIPEKMKALNLYNINDLRLDFVNVPKIKQNEVLIHIKNCGICSSDIERVYVNGTYHFPTIIGHEFSGQVIATNDEDKDLLGKKAAIFPLLPCNKCEACKIEEYAQCKNYNYFGSRCDGGFSEYLAVPKWNLIFEDDIDYSLLALCEPAAVSLHSIKRYDTPRNKKIFVMGSGTIGILIALFLKEYHNEVFVGARRKENMSFIKSLGLQVLDTNILDQELTRITQDNGFEYIFEVIGSNESIETCLKSASNFAKIVMVGNPKEDLKISKNIYWKVLRKQMTITGTWNSSYSSKINDWEDAIKIMKNNPEIYKKLITHKFRIDEYEEAFNLLRNKNLYKIKVMIEMSDKNE